MTNKEAIEVIDSIVYGEDIISKRISDALELARSVLEQKTWIPCSERLPENPDTFVLIQCNGKYKNITFDEAVQMATYEKQEGWILDGYEEAEVEVVAWMPLPEPYEEEKEMSKEREKYCKTKRHDCSDCGINKGHEFKNCEALFKCYMKGREDAIDEFKDRLIEICDCGIEQADCTGGNCYKCMDNQVDYSSIVDLAEELKEKNGHKQFC